MSGYAALSPVSSARALAYERLIGKIDERITGNALLWEPDLAACGLPRILAQRGFSMWRGPAALPAFIGEGGPFFLFALRRFAAIIRLVRFIQSRLASIQG